MKSLEKIWFLAILLAIFASGCGCGSGDNAPTLVSIEVSPASPSIVLGMNQQFTATGVYSDKTKKDLTATATWNSSDTSIASVSDEAATKGLAKSAGAGPCFITATFNKLVGSALLTVTSASLVSITVTPLNPVIANGKTQQFIATGTYSDNSTKDLTEAASWTVSNPAIASVSNTSGSKGLASALAAGKTEVIASAESRSDSTTLTVTTTLPPPATPVPAVTLTAITVTPIKPSIAYGKTQQFIATGTYSDNSTKDLTEAASWTASNPVIASVSNTSGSKGLASALAAGKTEVTASAEGRSDSTTLTVTVTLTAINVTPVKPYVTYNTTIQFSAIGVYSDGSTSDLTQVVNWTSSDTSIATISNAPGSKGAATTDHKVGSTDITAKLGGISGSTTLLDP